VSSYSKEDLMYKEREKEEMTDANTTYKKKEIKNWLGITTYIRSVIDKETLEYTKYKIKEACVYCPVCDNRIPLFQVSREEVSKRTEDKTHTNPKD